MAETNNNSNDNGGSDDAILAAIQSNIKSSKSKAPVYVFGDVIKDQMKAIYGDKWRAVVAKKSHNDADAFVRLSFPAGPGKYSYPSVEAGKAYLMAKTTKNGAPYWNPPLEENQICVMGDELPREIENSLYRYLIAISKLRLGILTEQGEGS